MSWAASSSGNGGLYMKPADALLQCFVPLLFCSKCNIVATCCRDVLICVCFVLDALMSTCYSAMHNVDFIRSLLPGVAQRRVRSHHDASQNGCYSVKLA